MVDIIYGTLALLGWFLLWKATQTLDRYISARIHKRREEKFLRYVRVILPHGKLVEAISIASSDKRALENIERRLRDATRHL